MFENFDWSLGSNEIEKMSQHYNLWSKSGHTPTFKVNNPEIYLKDFNWVHNWINDYFLIVEFNFGIIIHFFILNFIFLPKKNQKSIL